MHFNVPECNLFALAEERPIRGKTSIQKWGICNWVMVVPGKIKCIHFLNENGERVENESWLSEITQRM